MQESQRAPWVGGPDELVWLAGDPMPADGSPALPPRDAAGLLLAAWRDGGPVGVQRLEGTFACVLRRGDETLAYRDPSGLATLFAGPGPDGTGRVAAPDLAAFGRTPSGPARIDRRSLHEYLRLLDVALPATFLHGVQAVEPGRWLRLADGTDAGPAGAAVAAAEPAAGFDAAVGQLHALLARSVARCLASTGPVGAFLSGGVDSALLCALARETRPDLTALSVGFDGDRFDEAPAAARIAAHLGLRHEVLRFGRRDTLDAFERLARGMDQPMADPASMATLLAFEHCRDRFDVVLDGTGADEAAGALPPRHVRLAVGVGSRLPAWLRRGLVGGMRRVPALAGYTPILDFEHPVETLMRWRGFTRTEIEALCGGPVSLAHTRLYRTFARFPRGAHFARYSALLDAMPCDRVTQAARLSGLRVRYPFVAHDVDAFLRQLPTDWRHLPGQPKRILRALLARFVPREIWDGPKHGFDFPLHDFLAGDGHALVRRHVLDGRWLGRGLVRPEEARRFARAYIDGDRRLMFRVWALVVLGAWLDAHEDLT